MSQTLSPREALPKIRAVLEQGGSCRVVVTGTSMTPLLRHRKDTVLLSPLTRPAKKGDILFYVRGEHTCVLHRVVQTRPDGGLVICGDAQTQLEPVHPRQVVGIVSRIERGGRQFSANNPLWRAVSAVWMALRPVRPQIFGLVRRIKHKK